MGEFTYLMVLGSIALIFPILVSATYDYIESNDELDRTGNFYQESVYNEISNYTCDDYNRTKMDEYSYYFNTGWFGIPPNLVIGTQCTLNNDYLSNWIGEFIIPYNEILTFDLENNKGVSKITQIMGLGNFFKAMNTLPSAISTFIYSLYGMLIAWLVYKAFTLA